MDATAKKMAVSLLALIRARAGELSGEYPDKRVMFDGYIRSQANEYEDLGNNLQGVIFSAINRRRALRARS